MNKMSIKRNIKKDLHSNMVRFIIHIKIFGETVYLLFTFQYG